MTASGYTLQARAMAERASLEDFTLPNLTPIKSGYALEAERRVSLAEARAILTGNYFEMK